MDSDKVIDTADNSEKMKTVLANVQKEKHNESVLGLII